MVTHSVGKINPRPTKILGAPLSQLSTTELLISAQHLLSAGRRQVEEDAIPAVRNMVLPKNRKPARPDLVAQTIFQRTLGI